MDDKFLPKLSQNLLSILDDDDEYYDITIEVGNDPYVKIFRAHMVILNSRSPYLRRTLSTIKKKSDETLTHIKLPNILPEIFQIIPRYIYSGRLFLVEYETLDIVKILVTASELGLQELITHLQSFLIINETHWMEQNFSLIYQTSFENNSFLELQNFCTDLMSKQPEKIFSSPDFTSISEKSLATLIQHDNLQMSRVQVWEYVLKWGIAQNPELSSDPSSYSKDNFNALTNTLQSCIPFVKFFDFTSREFLYKVYPYKKIIPKELLDDLFKYFLDYDYNPSSRVEPQIIKEISSKSIDSKIESFQNVHVEIISKWVDRLEVTDEIRNLYEFKLILRGSRDGFTPKKFHEICDNQSHTVVIIKNRSSNRIFGGYNPIIWASNDTGVSLYGETKDSFIFSFENDGNIENQILSRVIDEKHAIYYYSGYGPSFGGEDLKTYGELTVSCYKTYYEKSIKANSSVEEYEVFQINV